MQEVEVKYRVDCARLGDIENMIKRLGGELVDTRTEEDIYYSHPCWDMLERDEAVRLRRLIRGSETSLILTYKGPRSGSLGKTREEIESVVDENIDLILKRLGFKPSIRILKTRRVYDSGDLVYFIDEVQSLGCFVEIESKSGDVYSIMGAGEKLGLGDSDIIDKTYVELMINSARG